MEIITIKELGELTPSKANIEVVSKQLSDTVKNGNADPIEFAIRLKFINECLDASMALIKDDLIQAIGNGTTLYGAKLELSESGVKYDYASNEQWSEIESQIKPLKQAQKEIEEQIKMATKIGKSIVDESTGELISPVTKTSTTTSKITLSK
jgi:formiminotetrahydrofolate cyclodeaminase